MGKMEAAEQTGSTTSLPNSPAQTVTLRQLSTERQNEWIERLFSRLAALYGAAFARQWEGTNLSDVKAVWVEKIGGFTAQHIGSALNTCDERPYPPNLPEFIELCRNAAKRSVSPTMIEAPQLSPEERMQRAELLLGAVSRTPEYDFHGWCKELKRRYLGGEDLLLIQEKLASEALGEVWEKRECRPMESE